MEQPIHVVIHQNYNGILQNFYTLSSESDIILRNKHDIMRCGTLEHSVTTITW